MHFHRSTVLILLFLCTISIAACDTPADKAVLLTPSIYEVDPLFETFYRRFGGEAVLGPAISHLFTYGPISYQYTPAGLMVHDPQAPEYARFSLAPLGLDLGVLEAAVQPPDDPGLRYIEGHIIDPAFLRLYQKLGEARGPGRPLTEARYNPVRERVEQYFENLGFYRSDSDPAGIAHLLAYGFWKCTSSCTSPSLPVNEALVDLSVPVAPELRKAVDRLGQSFTGFALSPPYLAPDGATEQIYENVILAALTGEGGRVILRSLPINLGITPEPLEPPSNDPNLFFYPISEGQGYNVPQLFLDYLAQHGGLDASGPPIGALATIREGVYRQCFANLCLEEHSQERGALRFRPTPLGFTYWQGLSQYIGQGGLPAVSLSQDNGPANTSQPAPVPTQVLTQPVEDGVVVNVWKKFPILAPGQRQEIGVFVLRGNLPLPDLHADLILTLPGGETYRYDMEPTGSDGQSQYLLEPMEAPLGKPVQYQVCVYYRPGEATCVQDSYLIWQ